MTPKSCATKTIPSIGSSIIWSMTPAISGCFIPLSMTAQILPDGYYKPLPDGVTPTVFMPKAAWFEIAWREFKALF